MRESMEILAADGSSSPGPGADAAQARSEVVTRLMRVPGWKLCALTMLSLVAGLLCLFSQYLFPGALVPGASPSSAIPLQPWGVLLVHASPSFFTVMSLSIATLLIWAAARQPSLTWLAGTGLAVWTVVLAGAAFLCTFAPNLFADKMRLGVVAFGERPPTPWPLLLTAATPGLLTPALVILCGLFLRRRLRAS